MNMFPMHCAISSWMKLVVSGGWSEVLVPHVMDAAMVAGDHEVPVQMEKSSSAQFNIKSLTGCDTEGNRASRVTCFWVAINSSRDMETSMDNSAIF